MNALFWFTFSCVLLLKFGQGESLKCRSGNQRTDAQYQKVMDICRKRYTGHRLNNKDSSDESSENDSSFEDVFDHKFLSKRNDYNQSMINQNNRNRQSFSRRGTEINTYPSNRSGNTNQYQKENNSRNGRNNRYNSGYDNNNNNNNNNNNKDDKREQGCIVQCIFNELNVVDHKGLPERDSVIQLMKQNIQDPELKDFVEESIIECFRYLEFGPHKEKCDFSQNLMSCLADKGQEKCEDWDK